jgi:hypothetical protein
MKEEYAKNIKHAGAANEFSNPIAMPAHFGYDILTQYEEGMEDSGDTLSRQVGGTHYKKGIQPWTIAMDWGLDPWSHNVVKYILRFPYKNGVEDLEKIKHYLDFLIENHDEVVSKYYK